MTNPLAWMLAFALAAVAWRNRRPGLARWMALAAGLNVILILPPVAFGLTKLWQAAYAQAPACSLNAPGALVLLPGGSRQPAEPSGLSSLTLTSILRLDAALNNASQQVELPILIVGTADEVGDMSIAAEKWGLEGQIVALAGATNTDQAARLAAAHPLVRRGDAWLLTSAAHMRRSLLAFNHYGADVCPQAVDFVRSWRGLLPDHRSVQRADALLHEVVGVVYYQLRYATGGF